MDFMALFLWLLYPNIKINCLTRKKRYLDGTGAFERNAMFIGMEEEDIKK